MSATRGVQGNTANLLRVRDGLDSPRTGTSCLSDTQDLANRSWIRCNASGLVRVIMADDDTDTPVTVFMNAGVASEFLVKRVLASVTAVAPADIVLLT